MEIGSSRRGSSLQKILTSVDRSAIASSCSFENIPYLEIWLPNQPQKPNGRVQVILATLVKLPRSLEILIVDLYLSTIPLQSNLMRLTIKLFTRTDTLIYYFTPSWNKQICEKGVLNARQMIHSLNSRLLNEKLSIFFI